jgi:hypothetical protein
MTAQTCDDEPENTPQAEQNAALIVAAVNALPDLLDDLEAAQKREQVLREALLEIAQAEVDSYVSVNELCNIARKAIADTEVQP